MNIQHDRIMDRTSLAIYRLTFVIIVAFVSPSTTTSTDSFHAFTTLPDLSTQTNFLNRSTTASLSNTTSGEVLRVENIKQISECSLAAVNPFQYKIVRDLVGEDRLNLIEYRLVFPNHTVNPLLVNMTHTYKVSEIDGFIDCVNCFFFQSSSNYAEKK
jgi:hypothetical protein